MSNYMQALESTGWDIEITRNFGSASLRASGSVRRANITIEVNMQPNVEMAVDVFLELHRKLMKD